MRLVNRIIIQVGIALMQGMLTNARLINRMIDVRLIQIHI